MKLHPAGMSLLALCLFVFSFHTHAQTNPTAPAYGFMVFAENTISVSGGDCAGPIASGGNMTVNGPFAVASNYAGTYQVPGESNKVGLYVGGTLTGNNQVQVLGNTFLKLGNIGGNSCSQNSNILEIKSGGTTLAKSSNNQTCSQVDNMGTLNIASAFNTLRITAACLASKTDNTTLSGDANNPFINCSSNAVNFITLTVAQLNSNMNLGTNAAAGHILVINVDARNTVFNWNGGFKLQNTSPAHTILNIYNTPTINFNNIGADVKASIFAPNSSFNKNIPQNIEGQVICINYTHVSGEVHSSPFIGNITCASGGPLAVSFTQLSGIANKARVQLNWATLQEQNLDKFIIQRSDDGLYFHGIGSVKAAGNSRLRINYGFVDNAPVTGQNFYRLEFVDLDGQLKQSNTIAINNEIKGISIGTVYPNPFAEKMTVNISAEKSQPATLQLFDNTGRLQATQRYTLTAGSNALQLDGLEKLAKGVYFLKVVTSEQQQTLKLYR